MGNTLGRWLFFFWRQGRCQDTVWPRAQGPLGERAWGGVCVCERYAYYLRGGKVENIWEKELEEVCERERDTLIIYSIIRERETEMLIICIIIRERVRYAFCLYYLHARTHTHATRVCVCVRERESERARERERYVYCLHYICTRAHTHSVCVWERERERESVCVCVCVV